MIDPPRLALIFSFLFFLTMLFIGFSYHKIGDFGVETDFYWSYVPEAKAFMNGHVLISSFRGPVYPIVLALFHLIIGEFFKSGLFISVLSASVVVFLTYRVLQFLFDQEIAFITAVFLVLNPIFVQYSYTAGTDMFFNAIIACILYLLLTTSSFSWTRSVVIGIMSGLAYLTRYNGIFILLTIPVVICVFNPTRSNLKKRLLFSILFVLTFFISILPWGVYCLHEKREFFYNHNYQNIAYELYGKGKMSWDAFWFGNKLNITSFADVVLKSPKLFLIKMIKNIPDHFFNDLAKLTGWHIGVFVIVGLASLFINRLNRSQWIYYIFNLCFFGVLLTVFYGQRFSLFLLPFYIVTALQTFILIQNHLIRKAIYRHLTQVVLIFMIAFTLFRSYRFNSKNISSGPKEILSVAQWFEKYVPKDRKGQTVSARKPHIAYYLGLKFVPLPFVNSWEELIAELEKKGIDYLYIGVMEASTRRELQFLLDPSHAPPELSPIVYTKVPPSVLYRIR
jgi:4-amino-4-deoxy-L-arabinose transferase-like glycosyltransferase